MDEPLPDAEDRARPPASGVFRWDRLLIWLPVCAALGAMMAWAAVVARGYFAPLVLFPLLMGVVLGGTLVLAMRAARVGHRPTVWLGALLAAGCMIVGEHYSTFLRARHRLAREPDKLAKLQWLAPERVPPDDFRGFMQWSAARGVSVGGSTAREGAAWLLWSIDALCMLLPALTLAAVTARLPYCNLCRCWYHTTRSGRVDRDTAARLAGLIEIDADLEMQRARYRLVVCQGGCGPTGIALSWSGPLGYFASGIQWLDEARRREVLAILDQSLLDSAEAGPIESR